MAETEFIGKLHRYNPETNILEIKVSFMTPDKHKVLEDQIVNTKMKKIKIIGGVESNVTYLQQKGYYKLIDNIMKGLKITTTSDNRMEFDEMVRQELFPTKEITLGDEITYRPKRMKEMSQREMSLVINRIINRYDFLDIKLQND